MQENPPMTAQALLSVALSQIVAPALRRHGFKGSGKTWRRRNELGDLAIVNVQSATSSTPVQVRCAINLAMAPFHGLRGLGTCCTRKCPKTPARPGACTGIGSMQPIPRGNGKCGGHPDTRRCGRCSFGMVQKLEVEGLPARLPLFERDKLLTAGEMMGPVDRVRAEDHHKASAFSGLPDSARG